MSLEIHEYTTSSSTTDKTSGTVRFKSANDAVVDTNDKLFDEDIIATYTTAYTTTSTTTTNTFSSTVGRESFCKVLRPYIDDMEGGSSITNISFSVSGLTDSSWDHVELWWLSNASYEDPYEDSTQNVPPTHDYLGAQYSEITDTSSNSLGASQVTAIGYADKYIYMLVRVEELADPGALSALTVTLTYTVN